jgi:hypothetical protein
MIKRFLKWFDDYNLAMQEMGYPPGYPFTYAYGAYIMPLPPIDELKEPTKDKDEKTGV